MELLDRETFLEWMERIMKRFDDLKRTTPDIPQRPMIMVNRCWITKRSA